MTKTFEKYTNICSLMQEFIREVSPAAERFFNFLKENDTYGYVQYELDERGDFLPVKFADFTVYFDAVGDDDLSTGIYFFSEQQYWEDSHTFEFTVPHEYFADPEKWERELLARITLESSDAIEAVKKFYPGLLRTGEEAVVGRHSMAYMEYPEIIGLSLDRIANSDGRFVSYQNKKMHSFEAFFFKPSSGELFERVEGMTVHMVATGQVEPVGIISSNKS